MRFNHILDEAFSTWSHIAVLRVLFNTSRPVSGREIARLAHMNHRSCLHALTRLERIALIHRNRGGRDHFFTLNHENRLWSEGIRPLLEHERLHYERFLKRLRREFSLYSESVIVYGEHVPDHELHQHSLHLCLVISHRISEKELQTYIDTLVPSLWKRYGIKLHTVILSELEFSRRLKKGHASVAPIQKDGQTIFGKPLQSYSE